MNRFHLSLWSRWSSLALAIVQLLWVLACAPPVERPKGAAAEFEDAKDMFKRGRVDRALEFTDELVTASPANKFTDRARVLRVVILSGQINAYKALADAYSKGVDNTKNTHHIAAYSQQRNDNLQLGAKRALNLGEVCLQLLQGGTLPKELTLEAPYPTTEGPLEIREFAQLSEGGWIEPDQQETMSTSAVNKAIDDALAEIIGGDRAKARTALSAGPVKLDGVDFGLYLGKELLEGASLFDRKHIRDSQKFRTLANQANEVTKATLALLKENPNKQKEQQVKKLQDQIKTALKTV